MKRIPKGPTPFWSSCPPAEAPRRQVMPAHGFRGFGFWMVFDGSWMALGFRVQGAASSFFLGSEPAGHHCLSAATSMLTREASPANFRFSTSPRAVESLNPKPLAPLNPNLKPVGPEEIHSHSPKQNPTKPATLQQMLRNPGIIQES